MKKHLLFPAVFALYLVCASYTAGINGGQTDKKVCMTGTVSKHPHILTPTVLYNTESSSVSIDFGNQPIDDYTVTISSPFTDMDYFVTSSYTTIPLSVDGISDYSIIIETAEGDVFEGVLLASDYSSVDSM